MTEHTPPTDHHEPARLHRAESLVVVKHASDDGIRALKGIDY